MWNWSSVLKLYDIVLQLLFNSAVHVNHCNYAYNTYLCSCTMRAFAVRAYTVGDRGKIAVTVIDIRCQSMSFASRFYKRRHINADISSQPGQITVTIVNLKCLLRVLLINYTAFAAATSKTEPQNTMPLIGPDACGTVDTSTGAFQATQLWEKIVMHLERSVKSRRRIRKLRTFEDCFPGSKAVECLTDYLNTILPKTIKRSQVQTLCQKLLLTGVIEDAKNKEKTVFHEGRLYRFTGFHFWEAESPDRSSRENGKVCLFHEQSPVHHMRSLCNTSLVLPVAMLKTENVRMFLCVIYTSCFYLSFHRIRRAQKVAMLSTIQKRPVLVPRKVTGHWTLPLLPRVQSVERGSKLGMRSSV